MKFSTKLLGATLVLLGAVSCQKTEIVEQIELKPALELLNVANKAIELPSGSTESMVVEFKSEFKVADLVIEAKEGKDLCEAAFEGENKIKITPKGDILEDLKTVFVVKAAAETKSTEVRIVYQPEEVEFTVTRVAAKLEQKDAVVFNNKEDKELALQPGQKEVAYIEIKANFPIEKLAIEVLGENDWLTAEFEGENKIKLTPSTEGTDVNKSAEFMIKGAQETKGAVTIYTPRPVKFKVTREKLIDKDEPVISFEFPEDIYIPEGRTQSMPVSINTVFDIKYLNVREKDNKTWCEAIITHKNELMINPTEEGLNQDMEANFIVEYVGPETKAYAYHPVPVEFKVIRLAEVIEYSISIEGEGLGAGKYQMLQVPAEGGDYAITIKTNAPEWYISEMTEPGWWYNWDATEGTNEQTVHLTVWENQMPNENNATFIITYEQGSYDGVWLTVQQAGKVAVPATGVEVYALGVELVTGARLDLAPQGGRDNAVKLNIIPVGGEVEFRFCVPGTNEIDGTAESMVNIGLVNDDPEHTHQLIPVNNVSGLEKSVDMVIVAAGTDTELFRLHLFQAAK